jgi:hypothetical protein
MEIAAEYSQETAGAWGRLRNSLAGVVQDLARGLLPVIKELSEQSEAMVGSWRGQAAEMVVAAELARKYMRERGEPLPTWEGWARPGTPEREARSRFYEYLRYYLERIEGGGYQAQIERTQRARARPEEIVGAIKSRQEFAAAGYKASMSEYWLGQNLEATARLYGAVRKQLERLNRLRREQGFLTAAERTRYWDLSKALYSAQKQYEEAAWMQAGGRWAEIYRRLGGIEGIRSGLIGTRGLKHAQKHQEYLEAERDILKELLPTLWAYSERWWKVKQRLAQIDVLLERIRMKHFARGAFGLHREAMARAGIAMGIPPVAALPLPDVSASGRFGRGHIQVDIQGLTQQAVDDLTASIAESVYRMGRATY